MREWSLAIFTHQNNRNDNIMYFLKTILSITIALVGAIMFLLPIAPSNAQEDSQFLSTLQNGLWQFSDRSKGNEVVDAICVGNVARMIQIKHKNDSCTLKMIGNSLDTVTYDYSCGGKGKGRTTIRKETNQLVQIRSQGVRAGQLFNFKLEARHAGACQK